MACNRNRCGCGTWNNRNNWNNWNGWNCNGCGAWNNRSGCGCNGCANRNRCSCAANVLTNAASAEDNNCNSFNT